MSRTCKFSPYENLYPSANRFSIFSFRPCFALAFPYSTNHIMAMNDRDLLHRRPVAPTTSLRRTSDIISTRQRRKRRSHDDRNKNLLVAFFAVLIVIFLLALLIFSKGKGGETDIKPNIEQWKPRLKNSATVNMYNNDEKASRSAFKRNHVHEAQVDSGELYRNKFTTSELGYDIFNCPSIPPDDYPRSWPITDIITNWNPNEPTTISPNYRHVYHSLCIFDYQTQYEIALAYRDAEKPFVSCIAEYVCVYLSPSSLQNHIYSSILLDNSQ